MASQDNVQAIEPKVDKVKKSKPPMSKLKKNSLIWMGILAALCIGVWILGIVVYGYKGSLDHLKEELFPAVALSFTLFGMQISLTQTVISGWITCGVLIVAAILYRVIVVPKFTEVPGKLQSVFETLIEVFGNMSKDKTGHLASQIGPMVFGYAAFICFGTLLELVGIRPPNSDINTCLAMGISTFVLINFYGLKEKGLKYRLLRYLKPIPIIPFITDLAVPVSLSFRMFGAILSGFLIMAIVWIAMPAVVPGFLSILFTLFHAAIQSYIFAVLSLAFIGEAVE